MKTQEIIEGNKLIAEFMGEIPYHNNTPELICNDGMLYHVSWDWLMPVVEKVENDNNLFSFEIKERYVFISAFNGNLITHWDYHQNTKIQATWLAVVEFIKWYAVQHK